MTNEENIPENVREVYQYIKFGDLLNGDIDSCRVQTTIIESLNRAILFSEGDILCKYKMSAGNEPLDVSWGDIIEDEKAIVYGVVGDDRLALYKSLYKPEEFYDAIAQRLPNGMEHVAEDIADDLLSCLLSRIVYESGYKFFEDMFEVYRSGGWPCGWDYENNRFFAYWSGLLG